MTDTEILDYLQESQTLRGNRPYDVVIGSVFFTLGVRHGTLREKIIRAIGEDQARIAAQVAAKLTDGQV